MGSILLTGATGYLGGCIQALAKARGLDLRLLEGRLDAIPPRSLAVDAVIHCAAARKHRPADHDAANRRGTKALLAGLVGHPRLVHVSSRSVYAPGGPPLLDEEAPVGAEDAYGASKEAAERLVMGSGHPWVVFRASAIIGQGSGQWGSAFPAAALRACLDGRPVTLHQPDRPTDYLHVGTFAALLLTALGPGRHWGQVLNAAGPPRSLHGLVGELGRAVEEAGLGHLLLEERSGPIPTYPMLSTRKLEAHFGPLGQPTDRAILGEMVRSAQAGFPWSPEPECP